MLNETMTAALNKQINAEIYSAYLYMAMSAQASALGLPGVANWQYIQVQEELGHAKKLYDYVNSQGSRVIFEAIDKPPADYAGATAMFEATLEHEKKVTAMFNDLMDIAIKENDHATQIMLQWFISEQVEEEENVNNILARLRMAGEQGGGLFMIDKELASRVYTPPTSNA